MRNLLMILVLSLFSINCLLGESEPYPKRYIRDCDILFKKHIVRSINLRKFNNEEIFGTGNPLVSILLDAIRNGELVPYKNGHLKEALSNDEFWDKLKVPVENMTGTTNDWKSDWLTEEDKQWAKEWEREWGKQEAVTTEEEFVYEEQYFDASQLFRIEFGEELIVDKVRGDIYFDPKYITIFIPAEINPRGIHEPIASFSFYDCAKIFRKDERAYSDNPLMNGRNINFTDVFLLRLYTSYIVKLGRIDDMYFDQMYSRPIDAFMASKKAETKVLEYLHKLFNPL